MPIAQQFYSRGVGNGLSFCNPVNVNNFSPGTMWVTLGGFKDTDVGLPTDAQIELSRHNAIKLFWNFYGFSGDLEATAITTNTTTTLDSLNVDNSDEFFGSALVPFQRVCSNTLFLNKLVPISGNYPRCEMEAIFSIAGYYSGSDFLGYGLEPNTSIFAEAAGRAGTPALVRLSTRFVAAGPALDEDVDFAYIELNGMHFVCEARARAFTTRIADAANLSAYSFLEDRSEQSVTITSLDFYTYS